MAILRQIKKAECRIKNLRAKAGLLTFAFAILHLSGFVLPAFADDALPSEYQVKAAFLVNFPKYVDWPSEAFAQTNSPIVLAVVGQTKVTDEIQKVVTDRTVNGHKLTFKQVTSDDEPVVCHILFVSAVEQHHLPDILAKFKGDNVLTVGESDNFLESGGVINLACRDQKIALEVNLAAAAVARLKISSKLLNVASVVKGKAN